MQAVQSKERARDQCKETTARKEKGSRVFFCFVFLFSTGFMEVFVSCTRLHCRASTKPRNSRHFAAKHRVLKDNPRHECSPESMGQCSQAATQQIWKQITAPVIVSHVHARPQLCHV